MADLIGQQLGDYRLTHLLGQGGFANVYLGEHIHLETQAAIKILHERLIAENLESFRQEARTIARLKHPHIVHVFGFGIDASGTPFLVMDYLPAGSIRTIHPRGQKVPLERVILYTRQVAQALQYAHDAKIIHRDVKPQNLLLGPNQEVILSDFGIAVVAHRTASMQMESVIGTALYMAPEQFRGYPTLASDQYSLGILVYEWLCGECPFQGANPLEIGMKHATEPVPLLRQKIPTLLPDIEQVVLTALAKDPKERFSSVQAFANALEQASDLGLNQARTFVLLEPFARKPSLPTLPLTPVQPTQLAVPPPPLRATQPVPHISSNPTTPPSGQLLALRTPQAAFPPLQTANAVQIHAKNIVCPECGEKDRIEKVSALAIKDISVLSQLMSFPEYEDRDFAPRAPEVPPFLGCVCTVLIVSGIVSFLLLSSVIPVLWCSILGIAGISAGISLLILEERRRVPLERKFAEEMRKFTEDRSNGRKRAYALWDRLYYCHRNDIVFVPGSSKQGVQPSKVKEMILQEYFMKELG